ncbi:FtsX-like permease family protein [Aquihabitans sp. G128]|uniref:ABC transporter permease n=1 Tax=Aquihabitans sp. G128 TaxID=2849779 RepID=UPI001C23345A|nr:FtsX-like permease family protein [Aquihabitans sp. G128]QXC62746.1 FtsX-like permease family protein [Aquihabitans sp. G128]
MSWSDAIRIAYLGVRRRVGRAVLTVAAVALAAALLTALLTIAGTARTRVISQLAEGGPLAGIQVAATAPDRGGRGDGNGFGGGSGGRGSDNPAAGPGQQFDLDDLRPIDDGTIADIEAIPEVRTALPVVTARVFARSVDPETGTDGGTRLVRAFGTDLDRPNDLPVSISAGRMPAPGATDELVVTEAWLGFVGVDKADAEEVLGSEVELGTGRATETTGTVDYLTGPPADFEMQWQKLEIVGVVVQDVSDGSFLVPLPVAEKAYDVAVSGVDRGLITRQSPSRYTGVLVTADSLGATGRVQERIERLGFATTSPAALIEAVQRYLRVVEIVLAAIGAIALAVAGLGITNALLASVRERRREIGVLKAIGARDRDVQRVFLVEAGVLGLAGGLLGAALGWATAFGVGLIIDGYLQAQGLEGVGAEVPIPVFALVIVGSCLLALFGGTLPARRAAHLPAREAVGGA